MTSLRRRVLGTFVVATIACCILGSEEATADLVTFDDMVGPCCTALASPSPQTITYSFPDGADATFSGGVVLTNESGVSTDKTSVYATSDLGGTGLTNPITINFNHPVTNIQFQTLNGLAGTYTAVDSAGSKDSYSLSYIGGSPANGSTTATTTINYPLNGTRSLSISYQVNPPSNSYNFAIDNVQFTPTLPQDVYLDFAANPNAVIGANPNNTPNRASSVTYNKPDADLSSTDITSITSMVQSIYSKYDIDFMDSPPASGPYDTIYIGGTLDDIPVTARVSLSPSVLGVAKNINIGDSNHMDSAVVFSGLNYFYNFCFPPRSNHCFSPNDANIAQVIGHETGHILGLYHVDDSMQLMYPIADAAATSIGGPTDLAEVKNGQVVPIEGFTQDSNGTLLCNLGTSMTEIKTCSGLEGYQNTNFSTSSTLPTLYDAQIIFDDGSADDDTGPPTYFLGTVSPSTNESLFLPDWAGSVAEIEGALTEGGDLLTLPFSFAPSSDGGEPMLTISALENAQVPEPNGCLFLLSALGLLAACRGYRKGYGW